MPNKPRPENRHRMVRVEDELWEAAKDAAEANGTTVSAVIRAALVRYVKRAQGTRRDST
jgi:antitoxin component of RelBE/YafQ-DinJ toxin-antitoxin module